jgi:hypothetical protein
MADLVDSRAKITAESDLMLDAIARSSGKDKSELIREILHGWYLARWEEHETIKKLFFNRCEGADRESQGMAGNGKGGAR